MTPERPHPTPNEPCLSELLRQAMAGLMPPHAGLNTLLDRMERAA